MLNNTIELERLCFPVTLKCNLRCKLCAERSPYYEMPYYPTLNEMKQQITALFELIDYTERFDITGGEPFLRKDLSLLIHWIHKHYADKIGRIRVTTNGTINPPENFAEAIQKWGTNSHIIIDQYPLSSKVQSLVEYMELNSLPYEVRNYSSDYHCDGWVDYGDSTKKHNEASAKDLYNRCLVPKLGFFTCMVNGKIFPCAKARLLYEQGIADVYLDAFSTKSKPGLQKLLGEAVIEACKYCNGLCKNSKRYAPAEQLTREK